MVGRTISHYRILGQLGAGGMGTVYRAEDVRLGREVALKFIADEFAHDPQAVQRLRSEARAASALNHGNICTIYDIDEHEGHPFIAMELIRGRTLRDRLASGPLKVHQLVDLGIESADALFAAHSDGIVHRDIKPANIFLTDSGHVKIVDFGLAKLTPLFTGSSGTTHDARDPTAAGVTLGTISYMSPEQATGEELDARTDLFSLGVVLYECATGRHPFQGKTSAVVLAGILDRAPINPLALNPELPARLQDVIINCLEKDRELRYQSAADLRADLKRVRRDIESGRLQTVSVEPGDAAFARGSTPASGSPVVPAGSGSLVPSSPVHHHRVRRLLAVAVAVGVVLGAASYALWRRPPEPSPAGTQTTPPANDVVTTRLAQATARLQARDYRGAMARATEVLSIDAHNAAAARIRDDSQGMLRRLDVALAAARERMAAGDLRGAELALDTARAVDPTAPGIADLTSRLDELRRKEADLTAARSRPTPEADARVRGRTSRESARTEPRPEPLPTSGPAPSLDSGRGQVPPPVQPPTAVPAPSTTVPAPPTAAPTPSPEVPAPPTRVPESPTKAAGPARTPPSASEPVVPPAKTAETTPAAGAPKESEATPAATSREADEAAIRRVTALYARAIEDKDLALFRSIKPNLTREEERRLREGFQAVTSQRVNVTVVSIDVRGQDARVVLKRRDTIEGGGRQQTADSQQTLTLTRTSGGWAIVDIR